LQRTADAGVLAVKPELQQAFDSTPEDTPRSRLEPYRELILRWRRQGRSYRRICSLLHDSFALKISYLALYEFVQRRSRPRNPQPELEAEQLPVMPAAQIQPSSIPDQAPRTFPKLSPEEAARRRDLLQSLRNKPALAPTPPVLEEFHYDPDKPLMIDRTIKD
jgi:hypothetical protein